MGSKTVISSDFSQKNCIEPFNIAQDEFLNKNGVVLDTKFPGILLELTPFSYCRTHVNRLLRY